MRKLLIAAALVLAACGGSNTDYAGNPGNPAPGNPGPGNPGNPGHPGYTYPQACKQFCQGLSTRALDCVRGQGHWTQQDLQTVTASCNRSVEASHTAAQDCQTATAEVARYTCPQICNLIGERC